MTDPTPKQDRTLTCLSCDHMFKCPEIIQGEVTDVYCPKCNLLVYKYDMTKLTRPMPSADAVAVGREIAKAINSDGRPDWLEGDHLKIMTEIATTILARHMPGDVGDKTLTVEKRVRAVHVRKHGHKGSVSRSYRKLVEEVGELGGGLIENDFRNIIEEAGDVLVMLMVLMQLRFGSQAPGYAELVNQSLDKCEKRLDERDGFCTTESGDDSG